MQNNVIYDSEGNYLIMERIFWLINLRWIASGGVIFTVYFVGHILKIPLNIFPLYLTSLALGSYNLIFLLFALHLKRKNINNLIVSRIANVQISLDLLTLTLLIHFSGGIENPFIFYFIFHMIIASILLSRRAAFLQATLAISLLILIVVLEYIGFLPHYCLKGFIPYTLHNNLLYIVGVSFVFITTLYIAIYMATSISGELRDREVRLRKANVLLKEKDRIKSEYVLRVSHDIKEHLSAIQSCVEPINEEIAGRLTDTQKELSSAANNRIHKLLFFVNALLEITKIRLAKEVKMTSFSLKEMLVSIERDIKERAKEKGVIFHTDIKIFAGNLKGVKVYLEEAVLNLLSNAIKYTPKGGEVHLKVEEKENRLLIKIRDSGIGIPKDEMPFIFNEFYRASNARDIEKHSSGLGLSITKEIIQMHKGKIWVESELGKGTTFYIDLPK
jgi:signal transduction histidine kinase